MIDLTTRKLPDSRRVAIELNKTEPTKHSFSMRSRERQRLLATCEVCCFVSGAAAVRTFPGCVRNISTGGVGMLTTRPMLRGEPIELEISARGEQRPLFLAGLVAFCRHVKDSTYEIGIQLVAQGREPIIVRGAATLEDQQEWVREALRAAHGRERRETA